MPKHGSNTPCQRDVKKHLPAAKSGAVLHLDCGSKTHQRLAAFYDTSLQAVVTRVAFVYVLHLRQKKMTVERGSVGCGNT